MANIVYVNDNAKYPTYHDACPSAIVQMSIVNWFDTELATGVSTKPLSK